MKKFIIIDHSLYSLQGHHYECSISVAEAAARVGYQPIILANRALSRSLVAGKIQIIPIFEVDWFNNRVEGDEEEISKEKVPIKNQLSVQDSWRYQFYLWENQHPQSSIFFEKVKGSIYRLSQWLKDDLRLLRSIPLSNTLWGLFKISWGLIRFIVQLGIKRIIKVWQRFKTVPKASVKKVQSFTETLAQILPTLNLTPEDQIFIHTFGIEQLEELYHFLNNSDRLSLPIYHLLFRRDPEEPLIVNAKGMGLKGCLQAYYDSQLWPDKIRFYTDTEDLVRKNNALSPVQVSQVPIPFRQEKLVDIQTKTQKDFIHLVYLGDARSEKGYQSLPDLVESLWDVYIQPGKIKFTIQSNYNVHGGEAQILEAKLILSQYPESKIRLINNPMSPDDYYQLLASADIVILPYNPQNYQRTSGVLTEALAAGKPVVVPAHSWLAQQVDESRASIYNTPSDLPQAVIRLLKDLPNVTQAAQQFSSGWRSRQSPDYLIQCLFKSPVRLINENAEIIKPTPQILLILEGDSILKGKNLDKLTYFCRCGYQVYGIFYQSQKSFNKNDLIQKLQHYGLQKTWILTEKAKQINSKDFSWSQYQKYLEDRYYKRSTLLLNWMDASRLEISESLENTIKNIQFSLVYIDSILYDQLVTKLGLNPTLVMLEVPQLYSYEYALRDRREIDTDEFIWEIEQFKKYPVLVTNTSFLAEKLQELAKDLEVYADSFSKNHQKPILNYQTLNQACQTILGVRALPINELKANPKIAMLYPWGDIHERKSGASQRSGLLLDYLQKESYEVACFSIGEKKKFWRSNIFYDYFEPQFSQATLVEKVYKNAYQSWYSSFNLLSEATTEKVEIKVNANSENSQNDWLPWIYYQFRFDPAFHQWIEEITDWADVVILEYPFWAEIVGQVCHQKNIKLILTAHDILAQSLDENSLFGKIALAEEINALKQADSVITLSESDQAFFQKYNIKSRCVPIGIDTQKINFFYQQKALLQHPKNLEIANQLNLDFCLFVGSQHVPNIEAVNQIRQWLDPETQAPKMFTNKFVIVGGCWKIEENGNFISLGKVDDELLAYLYQNASLVISPLLAGTGMSVKIIEGMAYGKVILGTSISFRGYPVESGVNCIICDTLESYPEIIADLLKDPKQLKKIGQKAQEFAQNYDYRSLYKTYLDLIL